MLKSGEKSIIISKEFILKEIKKMTNKIRSILGSILGWLISLIFMFAFQDNTKKSMTVYAQAICLAIILFGGLIVTKILALIPYLGWILTILLDFSCIF